MFKKLSRHGNSHAIVIDKPVLQVLGITGETNLKVRVERGCIVIEPVFQNESGPIPTVSDDPRFQQAYEKIVKKYGKALKKLAE